MEKRTFTDAERLSIVKESEQHGARVTCEKYKLSTSVLYEWKGKYKSETSKPVSETITPKQAESSETSEQSETVSKTSVPLKSKSKRTIGDVIPGKGIECIGCGFILEAMFKPCQECGNSSHVSPNLTSRGTLVSQEETSKQ